MKQQLSNQHIIDCLKTYYGLTIHELIRLPLGADINAAVYKAKTGEHSYYFVKLKYGHEHDAGVAVLELLQQAKLKLIIPPILNIHGHTLQCIDNASLMVQPFIEGENGFSHMLTEDQWISFGKNVRSIHEMDVPPSLQAHLRKEDFSPKWRTKVQGFYPLFEGNSDVDKTADEISQNLLNFLRIHRSEIYRLVNCAEELAKKCQADLSSFVLCHSDLHGGNILVDNNEALYIVDWDDPIFAPKERDLMFIGGGVGNVWNKKNEVELFYKGYGEVKIDMNLLAYYRHERIVEDIAIYVQQILFTDSKLLCTEDKLEMYKQLNNMFDPQEVVEIAFETGKN